MGSLIGWASAVDFVSPVHALPKMRGVKLPIATGPRSLSRAEWPPAIVPDFASSQTGYCLFADEFGRMAVVDFRRPGNAKTPVKVVGELSGLGRKIYDFTSAGTRAYALCAMTTDPADLQLTLFSISLMPMTAPAVVSKLALKEYAELTCVAASPEIICVAGTSVSGENLVTIYQGSQKGKAGDPPSLATFSVPYPVTAMDIQDRILVVLQSAPQAPITQLDVYNVATPRNPQPKDGIKIDGEFKRMGRVRSTIVIAGRPATSDGRLSQNCEAKVVFIDPTPHLVSSTQIEPITTVLSASAQRDRFLILGETKKGRKVVSLVADKVGTLSKEQVVDLPKPKGSYGQHSTIIARDRNAYIASGWAGVEVLTSGQGGWTPSYTYSIPRLPASGVASWENMVVLGGSDLKLYDITSPEHPNLVLTQDLQTSVKAIVGAGSYILCLSKNGIGLRKMDKLGEEIATLKTQGIQLCYDSVAQRAYVIGEQEKKSIAQRLKVYSNSLQVEKTIDLPKGVSRAVANNGLLLCSSLNDLYLYSVTDNVEQIGTRHFENLAARDFAISEEQVIATFIDQQSKGFFLVLSKDQKDMKVIGSVDLPHDGTAVAVQGKRAITTGRTPDNKSVASIVDFTTPSAPRVVATIPVVESASAVTIRDRVAIVVGRGLEILSLS